MEVIECNKYGINTVKEQKQPHGGIIKLAEQGEILNPNGRPKKSFSILNNQLKSEGYDVLTKAQLIEAYSLIFNCDEDRLKEISLSKDTPYALRIIILELSDKKARSKALADYRDYMFGKALQQTDSEVKLTMVEQPLFPDVIK